LFVPEGDLKNKTKKNNQLKLIEFYGEEPLLQFAKNPGKLSRKCETQPLVVSQ
jgi:hypothetical protein